MAPCALYQRLCHQLQACVPGLGVWSTRRLALLVTGLLLARHTALPRLAAQLRHVTPTAQADSIERRLRRMLAQSEWDTSAIFEGFARASLRHLPAGRCVLVLDDTQQSDRCILSTLALAYGSRALPLAWCRWSGQLHGRYWTQIDQLFERAERILPRQVQPVLLADRGLASPTLVRLVRQRGWDYLLRVQGDTTLRTAPRGPRRLRLDELVQHAGGPGVVIEGWVFLKHSTWAQVAAIWRVGFKEPWLLVSNLELGLGLADLYAQRMHIEAFFRDAVMLALWCAVWTGSRHPPDPLSSAGPSLRRKLSGYEGPQTPPTGTTFTSARKWARRYLPSPRKTSRLRRLIPHTHGCWGCRTGRAPSSSSRVVLCHRR
jgi:hypothetical protein